MPSTPLIVQGTITNADSSYYVSAYNATQDTSCSGTIDDDGLYLLDLANCGYAVDDIVYISVLKTFQGVFQRYSITQAQIDNGSIELNMTLKELPSYIYNVIYSLLNTNKPDSFVDGAGDTITWSVLSAFPDVTQTESAFPCIVIDPAQISYGKSTLDRSQGDDNCEITLEYFSKVKHGKSAIDTARGKMARIISENNKLLSKQGLDIPDDYLDESNTDNFEVGRENLNVTTQVIRFKWRP